MKTLLTRKRKRRRKAYHEAHFGRVTVPVYQRTAPNGSKCYMVADYSVGKRRFLSFADKARAIEKAEHLARQLSQGDTKAAQLTEAQAVEFVNAHAQLKAFGLSVSTAAASLAEILKIAGDLPKVYEALQFHRARHRKITSKRVADVVTELIALKERRGASVRYLADLRARLGRFADVFQKDIGNVASSEIQAWLDAQRLATQTLANFRRVVFLLFEYAVARGYATDNPVQAVERVKVKSGAVKIFTPSELARLLAAASPDFLPCLALAAFAGLRSAEIERITWADIDLAGRHIVVGADAAKTASRRIVPICDSLLEWLRPYAARQGRVWKGGHDEFYEAQQVTAKATEVPADPDKGIAHKPAVKWKPNGLRHSFASYRFAQTGDAGRVAGECGNSAAVIHRHYRELVKPADATKWFNVRPETPANVTTLQTATANA